jgi:hypothetical protein
MRRVNLVKKFLARVRRRDEFIDSKYFFAHAEIVPSIPVYAKQAL